VTKTLTANFGLVKIDDLHPLVDIAAVVSESADKIDAALTRGGVAPPAAQDLVTVAGRVTSLETSRTADEATLAAVAARTNNAGTSGVMAGASPPAGTRLLIKTYRAAIASNASGDATVTFPGGAFPNGVVSVTAQNASLNPIYWAVGTVTLSTAALRAYSGTTGAASLSINSVVTAMGW
jgi:hypothetical protein